MEFNQPLIYLLLLAGVVALLLRDWVDAGAIFAATLVNATIVDDIGIERGIIIDNAISSPFDLYAPRTQTATDDIKIFTSCRRKTANVDR
jgi:hypothetical protein